jgi:hypothetical protein
VVLPGGRWLRKERQFRHGFPRKRTVGQQPLKLLQRNKNGSGAAREFCGVKYQATMESCPDKFHVNIPNVAGARPCCTHGKHILRPHVLSSDRSDRLDVLQRTRIKNYHYCHRHYIVIHQQPLCVV